VHEFKRKEDPTFGKVEELFRALVEECKKAKGAVLYYDFVFDPYAVLPLRSDNQTGV
jgi:hypothetical protein